MKRNLIVDATNLLHRTYYISAKKQLTDSRGVDIGHVLYFLKVLKGLQDEFEGDRVYLCWDLRDDSFENYRHGSDSDYKGHRSRENNDEIHKFDDLLWYLCEQLGVYCLKASKMEADDIIAWLVLEKLVDDRNVIVSSDGDFIQLLAKSEDLKIYNPINKEIITKISFEEKNGFDVSLFLYYKAVIGDVSDNIKGLPKHGPVRSKKFVLNFKENFKKLNEDGQKTIMHNVRIMDLTKGYCFYSDELKFYENQLSKCLNGGQDIGNFIEVCRKMELNSIVNESSSWFSSFTHGKNKLQDLSTFFTK